MSKNTYCPFCNSEHIHELLSTEKGVDRHGVKWEIHNYHYSECNDCQEEFVTSAQARINDRHFHQKPR